MWYSQMWVKILRIPNAVYTLMWNIWGIYLIFQREYDAVYTCHLITYSKLEKYIKYKDIDWPVMFCYTNKQYSYYSNSNNNYFIIEDWIIFIIIYLIQKNCALSNIVLLFLTHGYKKGFKNVNNYLLVF